LEKMSKFDLSPRSLVALKAANAVMVTVLLKSFTTCLRLNVMVLPETVTALSYSAWPVFAYGPL